MDGYSNRDEIAALRFPGNPEDDPSKVAAPYKVITRDELESLPIHNQLMLMNTHKSGDFYAEYSGIPMANLLEYSGMLESATGITVYAPDGWAQYHPLEEDNDPLMYHVYGEYPQAPYYYIEEADQSIEPEIGWCDYSSPAVEGLEPCNKDRNVCSMIAVENGLKMLLAYTRDSDYLLSGGLNVDNKLDGEGPFRVVPPQKVVGPPDQSVNSDAQGVTWPFEDTADHNAGFSTRSATIIKVEPLPEDTTDIDTLEVGWNYVDENKILIYGALDPYDTILTKLNDLKRMIRDMGIDNFKKRPMKKNIIKRIQHAEKAFFKGHDNAFANQLESLSSKLDGCVTGTVTGPDTDDWITECDSQLSAYWAINEMKVLIGI